MVPRVYVTGVAGFLGSHLAQHLLDQGYEVRGCDDLSVGVEANVPVGVEFDHKHCALINTPDLLDCVAVVHCAAIARSAWPDQQELWTANVDGTLAVMRAAERVGMPRLIHASSSVVHHPNSSVYAQTKTVAERIALGHRALCLRFSNMYGPGQNETGDEPNVIAQMRRCARQNGYIRVDGDGLQLRDFLHVSDAVQAVMAGLLHPVSGIWLDVCTGVQTSILSVAERFGVPIRFAPSREDPPVILQDPNPARWLLHWVHKKDLEEGLAEVCVL